VNAAAAAPKEDAAGKKKEKKLKEAEVKLAGKKRPAPE
jgi:hypothetical protein